MESDRRLAVCGQTRQVTGEICSGRMRWEAIISLALMATLAVVNGEDLASQRLSPAGNAGEIEEPPLPTTEAVPSNPEPGLLPESGELPTRPRAVAPPKVSSTGVQARQGSAKRDRFEAVQSLAMGDRRAAYLLKRAERSSNPSSRRIYLRAYYTTVASRMRKLDPELKSSINTYEKGKLHALSGVRKLTTRPISHRARIHRSPRVAFHRKWHRLFKRA
jgi:hypothetical protein